MTDTIEIRQILKLEASVAEFEQAIEEQFKPALKRAIVAVLSETIGDFLSDPVRGLSIATEEVE